MVRILASAPLCSCRIVQCAREAERSGLDIPAAVLARVGLERHLKNLAHWWGCAPRSRKCGMHVYAGRLLAKRYINRDEWKCIKQFARVGSRSAHGEPVSWDETHSFLAFVERFIADHHVDEEWKGGGQ